MESIVGTHVFLLVILIIPVRRCWHRAEVKGIGGIMLPLRLSKCLKRIAWVSPCHDHALALEMCSGDSSVNT